ncbi:rRNA maturation RNase YbeY [Candidatus Parcubacteria bacterium]|nr:rRNA maturation RNase YbeY [Candidatus Parcubacteria bacterium]
MRERDRRQKGVSIRNTTRSSIGGSRVVFSKIAEEVLPGWDISLVFVGTKRARSLNKKLRGKTYIPNVLSYALPQKSGEIIICPHEAERQAPAYALSKRNFILYLFIHGILHIKGWAHSGKMEKCEKYLLARFAKG